MAKSHNKNCHSTSFMKPGRIIKSDITGNTFKLIENIGAGTFAQCWSAAQVTDDDKDENNDFDNENDQNDPKICLKIVEYYLLDEEQQVTAQREAALHAVLINKNIVRFHEAFYTYVHEDPSESKDVVLVIVMELCGLALDGYLSEHEGYFTSYQLLKMFMDIASALKYLHARELVHRDISTKNLLLSDDQDIQLYQSAKKGEETEDEELISLKLCDFGVSTSLHGQSFATTQIGTPHTMSPEIFDQGGYDSKADIWAAGCVFYELFTRKRLFDGLNYLALIKALEDFKKAEFSEELLLVYGKEFATEVMGLIDCMLNKDQAKRLNAWGVEQCIVAMLEKWAQQEELDLQKQGKQDENNSESNADKRQRMNNKFMKRFINLSDMQLQPAKPIKVEVNFNYKSVWIDYRDTDYTVLKKQPESWEKSANNYLSTVSNTELTVKRRDSGIVTPSRPPKVNKNQPSRINIAELKNKFKSTQKGDEFQVEIFSGLTKEAEEKVNESAETSKKKKGILKNKTD